PPLQCPVRNPYVQVEAENFDSKYGAVQAETCGEGGQSLGYIQNGDWVSYCQFDFKNGASNFSARIATNTSTSSGTINIRLDSATGTLVGTLTGSGPGGWQTYATRSCAVSAAAAGMHTLYLVFQAGYNVNWFSFTQLPVGVTADHPPANVSTTTFEGKLFCRELLTMASMDLPGNAAGVDVYSLQGKRILLYRTNGRWDSGAFEAFKKQLPSGMFYMKILER
ncbi:MAG: carbohydrate-binding protein, partial [Chitinispirillaceae bacterium]|nr:carbohydrate-binding protein [Chitinispirillaceae bacterium]